MAKLSKRMRAIEEKIDRDQLYPLRAAITLLQECPQAKFDESIDIAANLGVDARKSEQQIRGAVKLPHGTGKVVRVAVFAEGGKIEEALAAGADVAGAEDLLERMQGGELNYDLIIATPAMMPKVSSLGKLLGPRGLMPNPKTGTVNEDVAQAVNDVKAGQVRYRTNKNGIVHCAVGKVSFLAEALEENIRELVRELIRVKPAMVKGVYLRKLSLSTTMGGSTRIDTASI